MIISGSEEYVQDRPYKKTKEDKWYTLPIKIKAETIRLLWFIWTKLGCLLLFLSPLGN